MSNKTFIRAVCVLILLFGMFLIAYGAFYSSPLLWLMGIIFGSLGITISIGYEE